MKTKWLLLVLALVLPAPSARGQITGMKGQVFLPNGAPLQKIVRITLVADNSRVEYYYTDSNGRISLPNMTNPFSLSVDGDGETYDTTLVNFDPTYSGKYLVINLRPLKKKPSPEAATVSIDEVDAGVSPKAKEAYESATKLLQAGQYEGAIEPLKRAILIHASYFHAYNDLGVAYMKLNRLDEAADSLRHAIKINGRVYLPRLNLGIVLNRQNKYQEAAQVLTPLRISQPDNTAIHAPLIEALMGEQQWGPAEEEIRRALSVTDADVVDLKIKMGTVLIRQNKFAPAVEVLREAVKAEPDAALAHFNLGAALLQTGDLDGAEEELRRAYEIKGARMAGAQLMLGQVYFQKKDYTKAIEAFEAYLRDLPDAPNDAQVREAIQKLRRATGKP